MATGRKTVVAGQVIDPVAWGNPLWDQSVQEFASDADRTAQFPVAQRRPGVVTWLDDQQLLQYWDGAAWQNITGGTTGNPFTPWTSYVPAWLAGGTPVTIGSGGLIYGHWKRVGKTVDARIVCNVGSSGFAGGAAGVPWTWSLPIAATAYYWPVHGFLSNPGQAIAQAVLGAHIAGNNLVSAGVAGPGNTLVGGFGLGAGAILELQARYETP